MPSAKSARVGVRNKARNHPVRTKANTSIARIRRLIKSGDLDSAGSEITAAVSALDRAAQRGVIHRNNASRRKARLTRALNKAKAE